MTPFEARWCTDRVLDGTLVIDGQDLIVTDAGWDLILSIGAAGTALEGAELDREFVLGAYHGAGAVAILYNTIGLLEGILLATELGLDQSAQAPPVNVIAIDHTADPADDTPLQAAVRKLLEGPQEDEDR